MNDDFDWATIPLGAIIEMFPIEIDTFNLTGELDEPLYDALFTHWAPEIPYGIAKARDGDPVVWVGDKLYDHLNPPKKPTR